MNDIEKRNKYSNLMLNLKKATDNEYYYEAIFLEYAILEDRTESLLKHANIKCRKENEQAFKLSEKLRKIRDRSEFQDKYIKKHLPNELIDKVMTWKIQRDRLMHNIVNMTYENNEIKDIALEGECLVKRLNNKTKLVNNYLDKKI